MDSQVPRPRSHRNSLRLPRRRWRRSCFSVAVRPRPVAAGGAADPGGGRCPPRAVEARRSRRLRAEARADEAGRARRAPRQAPPRTPTPPPPTKAPPPPTTEATQRDARAGGDHRHHPGEHFAGRLVRGRRRQHAAGRRRSAPRAPPEEVKPYKAEKYAPAAQVTELPRPLNGESVNLRKYYPPQALKEGFEGDVVLRLLIDADGPSPRSTSSAIRARASARPPRHGEGRVPLLAGDGERRAGRHHRALHRPFHAELASARPPVRPLWAVGPDPAFAARGSTMKRIAAVIAGLSLLALGARADDQKAEAQVESHHRQGRHGTGTRRR